MSEPEIGISERQMDRVLNTKENSLIFPLHNDYLVQTDSKVIFESESRKASVIPIGYQMVKITEDALLDLNTNTELTEKFIDNNELDTYRKIKMELEDVYGLVVGDTMAIFHFFKAEEITDG